MSNPGQLASIVGSVAVAPVLPDAQLGTVVPRTCDAWDGARSAA
jgi:hypothetical protein